MRDEILALLDDWKTQVDAIVENDGILLFGSLVNAKGSAFKVDTSDVDLLIVIPDKIASSFEQRVDWLGQLKGLKQELEQKLLFLLKRENSSEAIVSLLPVTHFELEYDIHKGKSNPFFPVTRFHEIGSGKTVHGKEIKSYKELDDKFVRQIIETGQQKRNDFLKCSPIGNIEVLTIGINNVGDISKDLLRTAAKINWYHNEVGDDYKLDLSLGKDFLKTFLQKRIGEPRFEEIYHWIDERGEIDKYTLGSLAEEENVLLLYEYLFDEARLIIEKKLKRLGFEDIDISIKDEFLKKIDSAGLLEKSHSKVKSLALSDIYLAQSLDYYDDLREFHSTINVNEFLSSFLSYGRTLVAGESLSGKSVLGFVLFKELVALKYIPVYITDDSNGYAGNLASKIENAIQSQLNIDIDFDKIDKNRIIPIVDNFHLANKKSKLINFLNEYPSHLILVDDVFELSFSNEILIKSYDHFNIKELTNSQKYQLVNNWVNVSYGDNGGTAEANGKLAEIDRLYELVNTTLGKLIGDGIMPSFPFHILSIISTSEIANSALRQEITSQGHCYHALIYLYLTNEGVKDADIGDYLNFLTILSYEFCQKESMEITEEELTKFIGEYRGTYNLTVPVQDLLKKLAQTNIFKKNSIQVYSFCFPYLYYYFAGKYFAENYEDHSEDITEIVSNLHLSEYAYIAVFISHHTTNSDFLDELIGQADDLFKEYEEASLNKEELSFFDEQLELIVKAVLPAHSSNLPNEERKKRLAEQDRLEEKRDSQENEDLMVELDEKQSQLLRDLRRSIKTVEVIGGILKNRAGSMKKQELRILFEKGMNVHLRVLTSFLDIIKVPEGQADIISFISKRLDHIILEKQINPNQERIEKLAERVFWNTNFGIMYSFINKIKHSLGSAKLLDISESVLEDKNTPVVNLVHHGISMWYGKKMNIPAMKEVIEAENSSKTVGSVMRHQVVGHVKFHRIDFKVLQQIERDLKIPTRKLLIEKMRENNK